MWLNLSFSGPGLFWCHSFFRLDPLMGGVLRAVVRLSSFSEFLYGMLGFLPHFWVPAGKFMSLPLDKFLFLERVLLWTGQLSV